VTTVPQCRAHRTTNRQEFIVVTSHRPWRTDAKG
jgi:hypothetical protein